MKNKAYTILLYFIINISFGICVNITGSSNLFANSLENLMCNDGLSVGGIKCESQTYGIQDWIYSYANYFDNEIIDASITANSIIDRLNTAIDLRVSILVSMASKIGTLCTEYHSSGDTSVDIFDSLHFAGNEGLNARLPSDIQYSEVYGNEVSLSTTAFKIPNDVDYTDEIVQFDATISSLLTNHMIDLHNQYCTTDDGTNVYCGMYFGMTSGVFRSFPARENSRDNSNIYKSYDPRYRPWYVSAASGKKDVIILLDISGSMNINNRLALAKSAVISALNTLGSNSMVGIIAFSSSITLSCFEKELVPATPKNIELLATFVNNLNPGGGTDFNLGFEAVFDAFDSKHAIYGMNCHSSILFLTDGQASDPTNIINNRNIDINAVIFSYTLGDGADETIPKKISESTNGIYTHIDDGDTNLISAMSSYYLYYAHNRNNVGNSNEDNIIFTSPYRDFDTNILMITMAMPVYIDNKYFVGVVGADIPLTFLTDSIGDITIGRESYSFIIDEKGELITHPQICNPSDSTLSEYIPIYVKDVEPNEFYSSNIIENMINRQYGSQIIEATIKHPAGDVEYEGYVYTNANLLYIYSPIGPHSLSIAIVVYSESDGPKSFGLINSPTNECSENITNITYSNFNQCLSPFNLFHRLDLMLECDSEWNTEAQIMDINEHSYSFWSNSSISTKYASYYLQSGLYENVYKALNKKPQCIELKELHDYTNRNGFQFNNLLFDGFRTEISDNVLISIYILPAMYEFWKDSFLSVGSSFVSMYFSSYIGIMISFPAHSYKSQYNPLIRPWYQRSISYPNLFTFTTPYKDATTNSLVITGSTVIFAPNSSYPFGVAAFDFEYNQFITFYQNIFENDGCDLPNQIFCLLIDSSAFIVYYEGIENYINDVDISHKFLGDLEPTLFQSLLENSFFTMNQNINYMQHTTDITYHINNNINEIYQQSFSKNSGSYSIKQISKTNL
eukprot:501162_1